MSELSARFVFVRSRKKVKEQVEEIHLCSSNLSNMATISTSNLFVSVLLCFSCIIKRSLSNNSSGFNERKVTLRVAVTSAGMAAWIFEQPNPDASKALFKKISLTILPRACESKRISSRKSKVFFASTETVVSNLKWVIIFRALPCRLETLPLFLKSNLGHTL